MSTTAEVYGPLHGIRIVDLTRLYPGPLATMMLADMGAEVIKIEDPARPDPMRDYPPFVKGVAAGFLAVNRSKKSMALSLTTPRGKEIFWKLVASADIIVEQFRPGVLQSQGLDYQTAREFNRRIIYVSLSGYGQSGSKCSEAGHDINYVSSSGLLGAMLSQEGEPILPGMQIADVAGGAYMTIIACLSALWARQKQGIGQAVDVAMADGLLPLLTLQLAHFWAAGMVPNSAQSMLAGGLACYRIYRCADDKYVALGALEPKFWKRFCELVGRPEWQSQQHRQGEQQKKLIEDLQKLFLSKEQSQWTDLAQGEDICLTAVKNLDEVANDPHWRQRRVIQEDDEGAPFVGVPLGFSKTPLAPGPAAARLGQHSGAILRQLGYTADEIEVMKKEKIIFDLRTAER